MNKEEMFNQNKRPLILLTGCIDPMGMTFTKVQNPDVRRLQYIDAIKFYLKTTDNIIVFVENSGVDISGEFEEYKERLEILTFSGNNYDKALGKGYGEMQILRYAFENSGFIKQNSSVCKITGRYKILNIKRILRSYETSDCNVMVDLPRRLQYADSRIFIADKFFFLKYLFNYKDLINDSKGVYFEHVLNKAVLQSIIEDCSYLPLKYMPRIMGQSGTDNFNYDHSFSNWFPDNIRKMISFKLFTEGLKNQ